MVRAFAGDSTMTRRPRPPGEVPRVAAALVAERERFVAARRGVADVFRGIALQGLHAMRVLELRVRVDSIAVARVAADRGGTLETIAARCQGQ